MILFFFQLCKQSDSLLYWVWNRQIILPFYKGINKDKARNLSLRYLFDNGANINKVFNFKFIKNQTLFNMIMQNNRNKDPFDAIQILIDYKFDFENLFNIRDNAKNVNGLVLICGHIYSYPSVKLLIDHCKKLATCDIDITNCDIDGRNALHWAALSDVSTFEYLLSNLCFANNDIHNKNGRIALNQQDVDGMTIAHYAADNLLLETLYSLTLMERYNLDFNIHDNNNENKNGYTALNYAVLNQNVACVDVLCKQANIQISTCDLDNGINSASNAEITKLLMCAIFEQNGIYTWNDIEREDSKETSLINYFWRLIKPDPSSESQLAPFIQDLYVNGYQAKDYNYIYNWIKSDYTIEMDCKENETRDECQETNANLNRNNYKNSKFKENDLVEFEYYDPCNSSNNLKYGKFVGYFDNKCMIETPQHEFVMVDEKDVCLNNNKNAFEIEDEWENVTDSVLEDYIRDIGRSIDKPFDSEDAFMEQLKILGLRSAKSRSRALKIVEKLQSRKHAYERLARAHEIAMGMAGGGEAIFVPAHDIRILEIDNLTIEKWIKMMKRISRITVLGRNIKDIRVGQYSSLSRSKLDQLECLMTGCAFLLNGFDGSKHLYKVFLKNLQQVYNVNDARRRMTNEKSPTILTRQQWKILAKILQWDLSEWNTSNNSENRSAKQPQIMYGFFFVFFCVVASLF